MPVILLVVVAVVWIAILGRGMVRRRVDGVEGITSISDFHQQLRVLEHSSPPPIVAPAFRLHAIGGRRVSPDEAEGPEHDGRPVLTVVGAKDLPRPALAFLGQETDEESGASHPTRPGGTDGALAPRGPAAMVFSDDESSRSTGTQPRLAHDPVARQLALRRRRDVLGLLSVVFFLTMLAGFIPGASVLWTLTALSGLALTAYVVLLVQIRRRAEERERKLRFLGRWDDDVAAPYAEDPYPEHMVGRYAHPSHGAAAAT
jgi:hypothetical protein